MMRRGPAEGEAAAMLQAVLDALPDPVVVTDQEGRCLLANAAAARMAGVPVRALVGSSAADPPPADAAHALLALRHGAARWQITRVPVRSPSDGTPLLVTVARAVAAAGALEECRRVAAKMEAIRRFARRVAHDFNNIFAAIFTTAELLAIDLAKGTPRPEDVAEIRDQTRRAAAFARTLVTFATEAPSDVRPVSLNALVAGHAPLLRQRLAPDIELVQRLAGDLSPVRADPAHVAQILDALADNAGRAMSGGGRLTIVTANVELDVSGEAADRPSTAGRFVQLLVCDTGTGVDRATRERLFEPFFTMQGFAPEAGFGLATVYRLVRASGGWVRGDGESGNGATFAAYFPAAAEPGTARPRNHDGGADGEDPAGR